MKAKIFSIAATLSFLLFLSTAPAFAQLPTTCSNAMLNDDYAFTINGQIIPPGGTAFVSQQGVAMTHYDGHGKLTTQVDFVVTNGGQISLPYPLTDIRGDGFHTDESGTYTVNPDCTGTIQINFAGGSTLGGTTIDIRFVLADGGREIREVVKSITTPKGTLVAAIVADGKKLEPRPRFVIPERFFLDQPR